MTTHRARVLLTGAAGFIGSHIAERLLAEGYEVWGVDNFDPFYPRAVKESNLEEAGRQDGFHFREGDLRDGEFVRSLLAEAPPAAVIHMAARAGVRPSIEQPVEYYDLNIMATVRLLEAMREVGTTALVFGSSSSVYGVKGDDRPFQEEELTDRPISPYAATKRAGELLCHTYHHLYGFSCACLRLFTVYGPRQRPDLAIHKFARLMERGEPIPIYGTGEALRDYTYVADTVEGVVRALDWVSDSEVPVFEIMNIGGGRTTTVNELVAALAEKMEVTPRIEHQPEQPGDVPTTWADINRARRTLGYDPRFPLAEGLGRFVEWFRERPRPEGTE